METSLPQPVDELNKKRWLFILKHVTIYASIPFGERVIEGVFPRGAADGIFTNSNVFGSSSSLPYSHQLVISSIRKLLPSSLSW